MVTERSSPVRVPATGSIEMTLPTLSSERTSLTLTVKPSGERVERASVSVLPTTSGRVLPPQYSFT